MDIFWLRIVFDAAVGLIAAGAWLYAWRAKREQVTRDQIEASRSEASVRLSNHSERLARLESTASTAPRSEHVHDLALSIKELRGDIKVLTSRLDGTDDLVTRVETVTARQGEYIQELGKMIVRGHESR